MLCCPRYLRNITIPAAFVTKSTGDALKELVAKKPTGQQEVIAVMDWTDALPKADKVEWEFWTNSNDQCGAVCDVQKEFIKVLKPTLHACLSKRLSQGLASFYFNLLLCGIASVAMPCQQTTRQCHHVSLGKLALLLVLSF